jgi:hypothetical protein
VGMSDGLVSVSRRLEDSEKVARVPKVKYSFKEWDKVLKQTPQMEPPQEGDTTFEATEKKLLSHIDRHLSSYRYSKALETAMSQYIVRRKPEVIVTLMQELIRFAATRIYFNSILLIFENCRRKGLRTALAGKDERELVKIIKFLTKFIGDFELTATLVEVGNTIIGNAISSLI